jgi:hypothetical protein
MSIITTVWIIKDTGVRFLVGTGNPNTLGLICPIGSLFMDDATGAYYKSVDPDVSDWDLV